MKEFEYPFDSKYIMRKRKTLKRMLLEEKSKRLSKRIAVLGGSTTNDIVDILELFLLNYGIEPVFYQSEYGQYWQDAVFENLALDKFKPDLIYIHTSNHNIMNWPEFAESCDVIEEKLQVEYQHYEIMWNTLYEKYHCPIIQNNFELPSYRLLGNQDASRDFGYVNYITKLNILFYNYSCSNKNFYINDINYQSADYGLAKWQDPFCWYMYKYSLALDAIPILSFNIANIIKSIYGKNKKAIALDLDNTLWGGIIGDDGIEGIAIGPETSVGQIYTSFQEYLAKLQKMGIPLNVISKNEEKNALKGLEHSQMVLKPNEFIIVKTNWEPKSINLMDMAEEMTLLPESFVFVDDNPAEREIIRQQVEGVAVPELSKAECYIREIDRAGYFESTIISADDTKRTDMYKKNVQRSKQIKMFVDYSEYLKSLQMKAIIKPFEPIYWARIAQLTNKSNQYNLTTRRYTQEEIERISGDEKCLTLYGKLEDCFGDNGVVSLVIGEKENETLHIILWLMSCRVLKRDMEFAMMDEVVKKCKELGIKEIKGYYYPTEKNEMVKEFYKLHGFENICTDATGNSEWFISLDNYLNKNRVIVVNEEEN